jgi:4-amino-4-deoxy-L-arabinose transferase-like glycosyltransferase
MPPRPTPATPVVVAAGVAKLGMHLMVIAATPYGIHRDEFLYMAMGRHLRLFRMDFPPAIALIAQGARAVFGDTLFAVRIVPAIAGTVILVLAALLARELGGGWLAQGLAALAILTGTVFQRSGTLFQPVVLDQLWWTLALYILARLLRTGDKHWWLALGAALGIGLLTKFSVLFFGLALAVALLVTRQRRAFLSRWPWVAAALALVIGSPSIVGQIRLGYPVLAQMRDLQSTQLTQVSATSFLAAQPWMMGPAAFALALTGAVALIAAPRWSDFRLLGWTCVLAFALVLLLHGKPYYVTPIYPALCAAGAACCEGLAPTWRKAVGWSAAALMVARGLLTLPLGVPLLPPPRMAAYVAATGMTRANRNNRGGVERLPQDYADMIGWPEMVSAVARVYHALGPAERNEAVVIGANYGEAGAIDFYGPRYALPAAVSPVGSYWFFGPGTKPGRVLVVLGATREDLAPLADSVVAAAHVANPWGVSEERDDTIWVVRRPHRTLQQLWPEMAGRQ